jgi:hypothetical protein
MVFTADFGMKSPDMSVDEILKPTPILIECLPVWIKRIQES